MSLKTTCICDKCGKEITYYKKLQEFFGYGEWYLCNDCYKLFTTWMSSKRG